MKLLSILVIGLVQASPLEKADKRGIATAAFDEKTPNVGNIGCGGGTIVVTQVYFYLFHFFTETFQKFFEFFGETKTTTHAKKMSPRK